MFSVPGLFMAFRYTVFLLFSLNTFVIAFREIVFLSVHSSTSLAYSLDYVGPAIDIAVREINRKYSSTYRFSLLTFNRTNSRTCADVESDALPFVAKDLWMSREDGTIWAILAPGCSGAVVLLADLAREWNIPIVTAAGTDATLDSRVRFPTLLRLLPYQQLPETVFVGQVCNHFRWTDIAIICDDGAIESNFYALICKSLTNSLNRVVNVNRRIYSFNYNFKTESQHRRTLIEASRVSRVFLMITHASRLKLLLATAADLGMAQGEYAFMAFEPFPSPNFGRLDWRPDPVVKQAFEFLLVISTSFPKSEDSYVLDSKIKNRSAEFYGKVYASDEEVSPFVYAYYDGVHLLAQIITENWDNRTSFINDSSWIANSAWMRTFHTQRTNFSVNDNGDMDNDYVVRAFDSTSNTFLSMMARNKTGHNFLISPHFKKISWPRHHSPPANRPECGYSGNDNKCSNSGTDTILMVGVSLGVIAGSGLLMFVGFAICRRYMSLYNLQHSVDWIIPKYEVQQVVHENLNRSGRDQLSSITTRSYSVIASISGSSRVRLYRGDFVWTRSGDKDCIFRLDHTTISVVNLRKSLINKNIAILFGLCVESLPISAISEYFQKGSLYHLLLADITIDRSLQYSLLTGVLQGLLSIHQSAIQVHGSIKTHNCMITNQLEIKLADFGLPFMIKNDVASNLLEENYEKLLWTAPEVLKTPESGCTRESDVYSFGVVAHQVFFLTDPYQPAETPGTVAACEAKELVQNLINDSVGLFRPLIPPDGLPSNVEALLAHCWNADPSKRPTASEALAIIETRAGIRRGISYMDIVIARLEKYAVDLEMRVVERTDELLVEKKNVESLLQTILPKSVAIGLISGEIVPAELFESATVAFSGIWEFGTLVTARTPLEMTYLLNDLYSKVDDLLPMYDVYKVETINDSYMLVSGVPSRNGSQHVSQVSLLCCGILNTIQTNLIGGININVQIGIHSGALAAGVVGRRMPRYCLFGDTVNIASRMMTTCDPQKIQISRFSKELLDLQPANNFQIERRGEIAVKGKGMMETFWLNWKNQSA